MITDKFEDLKSQTKKNKAIILGCGPSLSKINEDKLRSLSEEYLIVTIKQSYNHFADLSDLHFFNCNNVCHYPRKKAKFIVCSPNKKSSGFWTGQKVDFFYHMSEHPKRFKDVNTEHFFDKDNMGKYWGPGIMTEIVMPFLFNLGVKEIITCGWDLYENEKDSYKHFYPEVIRKSFSNPAAPRYDGENAESIKNSEIINNFFNSQGINLSCINSKDCFLHESISRVEI